MKHKIDNHNWIKGFLIGGLFVVLIILSGKSIYRAIHIIDLYEAKIILFILGIIVLLIAIIMFIKASKKITFK